MIYAQNSYFKNNRRAVSAIFYKNLRFDGELNYEAQFKRCQFINDGEYLPDNGFYSFISLWEVKGLRFQACTFDAGGKKAMGIDAIDAGFRVSGICSNSNGCTAEEWERSEFYNFDKAIYARNTDPGLMYPINILQSFFFNNNFGAHLSNLHNLLKVRSSEFVVGNDGITKEKALCGEFLGRGIHIQASNGFEIEHNTFSPNPAAPYPDSLIGILAIDNPSNGDVIYGNDFTGFTVANRAYGNNREGGTDPHGIEYQCNTNEANKIDFEVVHEIPADAMINPNIGYTNISARNTFTDTDYEGLQWHWRNMGMQQENYYMHPSEREEGSIYEPDSLYIEYTDDYYTLFTKQVASAINQCPDGSGIEIDKLTLTPQEQTGLEIEFVQAYQDFEAVESIFNDLKDGGSTTGTSLTVEAAQPGDTWELRDNLLGKSPHLSREVLKKAANKTEVLPNSVLLEILAANPDELKKEDFMQFLKSKEEPLPGYMIDILRELSSGTTYKTALLNQMGLHKRKQVVAAKQIIKSLVNEEEQDLEAIKGWLGNLESLQADMQIASIMINNGDFNTATALLDLLPDVYNLEDDVLTQYLDDKYILSLKMNLEQDDRNIMQLNSSEIAQLENIAEDDYGMARTSARNILEAFYGYDDYCDCMNENSNKSASATSFEAKEESPLKIEATPNPATHYVEFYYELSEIDTEGIISITDINGKLIQTFNIKRNKGLQAWDTREIPAGTYIFTLKSKYFEKSDKLIIQ